MWALVLPIALQNLLSAIVSASDALMLGLLDQASLAAVSLATQVQFVLLVCGYYMIGKAVNSTAIGDNCWIGAGVTICPGVTIGENTVIGAGSVVTHDIPANVIAVGNPCRVLREINEQDKKYYYKDREITKEDLEEEARLR